MELSKRLQAVANLTGEGLIVADVGTDHGYIPIYLVESKKSPKAFAMDINEGPLLRAKQHIQAYGLAEVIETRLSDGVKALKIGECECVVVAGMGGALAIKIMEEGENIFRSLKEFVLQPQSEIEKVRRYLCEHQYCIVEEDMVLEDGKYYPIMKVISKPSDCQYSLAQYRYGKSLLAEKHAVLESFLKKEIVAKQRILRNLECEMGEHIKVRMAQLKEEIACAEHALKTYF